MSTAQHNSAVLPAPSEADPAHLDLVPVDPHRLFAHWSLAPRDLGRLRDMAGDHAADHLLTLRVFRLPDEGAGLREAIAVEDFPVGATNSDGYFSLGQPGGSVVGVLGIKNAENRFTPAVTSARVTLPEAPPSAAMAEPHEAVAVPAIPEADASTTDRGAEFEPKLKISEKSPVVLDEDAVVAAAEHIARLPEQLRTVPSGVAPKAKLPPPTHENLEQNSTPPDTPALDERSVVTSALRHMLADVVVSDLPEKSSETVRDSIHGAAQTSPASVPGDSSYRLASQMGEGLAGAPVRMRATLAVTGRLAPGQKLRVGDKQITAGPGGSIAFRHELDAVDTIWPLLLHVVLHQPTRSMPSLELLSELPDSEALLSLHANIDIEGEIHDPAYRSRLPREVKVDAAGRFRVVRPLPAGALLLPHLVLVSSGDSR